MWTRCVCGEMCGVVLLVVVVVVVVVVVCVRCKTPVCGSRTPSVCTFKTFACAQATRPRVQTHADVLPVHTETL